MKIAINEYKVKVRLTSDIFKDEERWALCREDGNPLPYPDAPKIPPIGEAYPKCQRTEASPVCTGCWEDTIPDNITTMMYTDAKTGVKTLTAFLPARGIVVTYYNVKRGEDGVWTAEYKSVSEK